MMQDTEALDLVKILASGTANSLEWSDESLVLYASEIVKWDWDAAAWAIDQVLHTWEKASRPPLALLGDWYHRRRSELRNEYRRLTANQENLCGGMGWLPDENKRESTPCPLCNPHLSIVFSDIGLRSRWLDGTPIERLVDFGEDSFMPLPCSTFAENDPTDVVVPPSVGREIAKRSYQSFCAAEGIQPTAAAARTIGGQLKEELWEQ
jgi:hypothetical protein